ncbi:hypothetical protein CC86DRAFT_368861 [Ophiobolus disseminans]|uniref:Uncharacterized protein n=1 Tax=Ophiobolus disseminans TaxID=1469910 RepID=A0A6A7A7C5_9PLEO|nr:hypothetical protein CC86DRAFT_368861 [Ophiobolus disseminans]
MKQLLLLSDDPKLASARNHLLERTGDEEMEKLVLVSIHRKFSRKNSKRVAATLLDIITQEQKGKSGSAVEVKSESEEIQSDDSEIVPIHGSTRRERSPDDEDSPPLSGSQRLETRQSEGKPTKRKLRSLREIVRKKQRNLDAVSPQHHPDPSIGASNTQPQPQGVVANDHPRDEHDVEQQDSAAIVPPPGICRQRRAVPIMATVLYVPNRSTPSWKPLSDFDNSPRNAIATKITSDYQSPDSHKHHVADEIGAPTKKRKRTAVMLSPKKNSGDRRAAREKRSEREKVTVRNPSNTSLIIDLGSEHDDEDETYYKNAEKEWTPLAKHDPAKETPKIELVLYVLDQYKSGMAQSSWASIRYRLIAG